jgi:acyl-coenzyme A synthetase/AMP-(fatty) acid ligase
MIFYKNRSFVKSYNELFGDINKVKELEIVIKDKDPYVIFTKLITAIVNNISVILIDSDLSAKEIQSIGLNQDIIKQKESIKSTNLINIDNFNEIIFTNSDWKLTIYTSGTTGLPKKVDHSIKSLTRNVKISNKFKSNIWGFAFNPTHIAGLQVFFQALLNNNTLVDIFAKERNVIIQEILDSKITNISATSTYYRLLAPFDFISESVLTITSGGEKFDSLTINKLKYCFPHAKIRNIYASTEAGTIFTANGEIFSIPENLKNSVKIKNNEILIKTDLLGIINNNNCEWYETGDIVEILNENPLEFKFIHRKNEMINIGGYKVNPLEVEEEIRMLDGITDAYVYGKKNSVLGTILCADIVSTKNIEEKYLRHSLLEKLQNFKIPRIINFVDKLVTTRTGKIKR